MEPAAAARQCHQMVASPRLPAPDPRLRERPSWNPDADPPALKEAELRSSPEPPTPEPELGSSPAPTPPLLFAVKPLKISFILIFSPLLVPECSHSPSDASQRRGGEASFSRKSFEGGIKQALIRGNS